MNNPLNRRMFRQNGMSKQPMGILASSPELMTTAQKAMMNNKPIKAQSAVSVNTKTPNIIDSLFGTNIGSTRYMQPGNSILKDLMSNFSSGPEKTYETKLIPEGAPPVGFIETTKKPKKKNQSLFGVDIVGPDGKPMKEGESIDSISGTPLKNISKVNKEFTKKMIPKENDSEFMKDIKNIVSNVSDGYENIVKNIDDGLNYFRTKTEKQSSMQKRLDAQAESDPRYQYTNQFAGPQRLEAPKKGEERGLVDPNVLSPADPRFPESFPEAKPSQVLGLSIIDKIKEGSKTPKGISTNDADKALGIGDLSFKDRVKARRDIISAALGRDVAEKDVRTDLNYNLMMTGLLVAAGQSPDAMTNIAQGLAAGLAGYGKAKGEATEAKRKEDIAIGLAAVEQTFKETEAEKARDKKPDSIRTAEYLQANPELIPIIRGIKAKTLSDTELRAKIVTSANRNLFPGQPGISKKEVDRQLDAIKGVANSTDENAIPNLNIISKYNLPDSLKGTYPPRSEIDIRGKKYKVSEDGNTATLMG